MAIVRNFLLIFTIFILCSCDLLLENVNVNNKCIDSFYKSIDGYNTLDIRKGRFVMSYKGLDISGKYTLRKYKDDGYMPFAVYLNLYSDSKKQPKALSKINDDKYPMAGVISQMYSDEGLEVPLYITLNQRPIIKFNTDLDNTNFDFIGNKCASK